MLKYLKLQNVGPADEMELELGSRLNILTGDNGLGKSFLLDVAWFTDAGIWPANSNPRLTTGTVLLPSGRNDAEIKFQENDLDPYSFKFDRQEQSWLPRMGFIESQRLVVYLMADGSSAVVDPFRKFKSKHNELFSTNTFVFTPFEILNGLTNSNGKLLSNGLIADWSGWQKENGRAFSILCEVLSVLSPDRENVLRPGPLTRISVDDVRDIPTIESVLDGKVAVIHASAGIRRILTLAYLLVWTWEEHLRAAEIRNENHLSEIMLLIDEVDAHLHPGWQRKIIPALLEVVSALSEDMSIQVIATTHSPLIMASLEPLFDPATDAWFDLDLVGENGHRKVELRKREFEILGNVDDWLTSEAFDLESARSLKAEETLKEAEIAMDSPDFDYEKAKVIYTKLKKVLPADDSFFMRWRMVGKKEGWWK